MIFAMADIHGCLSVFKERVKQLEEYLNKGDKLLLLGDFVDRGPDSCGCLQFAKELQDKYGKDKVIVLKGNHEVWFLDFINNRGDEWLCEDTNYNTTRTFLSEEEYETLNTISIRDKRLSYLKKTIKNSNRELLKWVTKLPLYYETPTQIFVHAGVDEEIPEEEMDYCTLGTVDYIFTGKFPPSIGKFYKDIIAGHVSAAQVAGDKEHRGIYFDGYSHYFIDGTVNETQRLLCLAYDEDKRKYYEFLEDGKLKLLHKYI